MPKESIIKVFEGVNVRIVWDEEKEEYLFAVSDIVEVLTESKDVKQYIKKLRSRDPELNARWGTICTPTRMQAADGKFYKTQATTMKGILRIVQSIPSRKAEPLKQWLAEVGSQRIDQMIDPELAFQMAVQDYRRQGYSERWITQRMRSIEIRKGLTDEWERAGVRLGQQYASLTDIITRAWSGKTTRQYKQFKGLKKENLRDTMTNTELILNMLAESAATDLSKEQNPQGYAQSAKIAKKGGSVAKAARDKLESQLGHSVISSAKASDYLPPVHDAELLPDEIDEK